MLSAAWQPKYSELLPHGIHQLFSESTDILGDMGRGDVDEAARQLQSLARVVMS